MDTCRELEKLPRRIEAEEVLAELTRASDTTAYRLRDTVIAGDLNLRHRQVTRPVEFHGCHFCGEVDLCYSEFTQTVDLSHCVFHKRLNSGDRHHTRAFYHKDLICTGARFKDLVSFNRAYVEGHASFEEAHFEYIDEDGCSRVVEGAADFSGMQIDRNFICSWATFERGVSFNALHCRTGEFHGTRFESEKQIDFRSAYFRGNIEFEDLRVERRYIDDRFVDPREREDRPGPIVKGKLNMRGFRCDRRAIFCGVDFAGEVDCEDATFGWYLDCRGARFREKSSFVRAHCDGTGFFADAAFEDDRKGHAASEKDGTRPDADFRYARFKSLELSRSVFHQRARLGQVQITEKLRLDEAWFHSDVLLYGAQIGTIVLLPEGFTLADVMCPPADRPHTVPGPAQAQHEARRSELADLRRALEALRKRDPEIREKEEAWLKKNRWLDEQMRKDTGIRAMVTDYFFPFRNKNDEAARGAGDKSWMQSPLNCRWTKFWFGTWAPFHRMIDPEPAPRGVELDGCTFARIHAGPLPTLAAELIRAFAASQNVDRFSRDVYVQLERFYNQAGDEERARDVHLWGHLATRRNACTQGGAVRWSLTQKAGDSVLMLTGWGLQTWRIWFICLLIVLGATLCFGFMDDVLRVESESASTISSGVPGVGEMVLNQSAQASGEAPATGTATSGTLPDCVGEGWNEGAKCFLQRGGYSLTTFIPAISLGLDRGWEPANGLSEIFRALLVLSGWLFVPLGIGAMTGIIRSDRR